MQTILTAALTAAGKITCGAVAAFFMAYSIAITLSLIYYFGNSGC